MAIFLKLRDMLRFGLMWVDEVVFLLVYCFIVDLVECCDIWIKLVVILGNHYAVIYDLRFF